MAMGTRAGGSRLSGTAGSFGQEASAELATATGATGLTSATGASTAGVGLANPRATVSAQLGQPAQRGGNMGMTRSAAQSGIDARAYSKLSPEQEVSAFYEFSKEFAAGRKNW